MHEKSTLVCQIACGIFDLSQCRCAGRRAVFSQRYLCSRYDAAHCKPAHTPKAPPFTTSWYKSTLSTSTSNSEGCAAAQGNPGLVVLDFGEPALVSGVYGTLIFDSNNTFASDSTIYSIGAAFMDGATSCDTSMTNIKLAIGTSNYNGALGSSTSTWYNAGVAWGNLINQLKTYAQGNSHLTIYAADDMEVEWASYSLTSNFVNGYNATTSQLFVDYGDDSGGANPSPYTADQLWYIASGAPDDVALPEIYYNVDATLDWQPMDVWACQNMGQAMKIIGKMAEDGVGGSNKPNRAWKDMYAAMGGNSCTSATRSQLVYSTNIQT